MSIGLLVITDGRFDYLERTLTSAADKFPPPGFDQHITIDDSDHSLGFAGAIQAGWEQVQTDWVFHLEADFTFNEHVAVNEMIGVLERHPRLAQVALKRQPWNEAEIAAGGIVELSPEDFDERQDDHAIWTEHRRFFTTNPCVYSAELCRMGWPQARHSEGLFTHQLLDVGRTFAFWGGKLDAPRVHHIGDIRAGSGY